MWKKDESRRESEVVMLTMHERTTVEYVTEDVGNRIRERRARLGLSVKGLAEHAGVDRGRLAAIESGKATNVRATTLSAVERALDDLEARHEADDDLPAGAHRIGDPADDLVEFTIEGTDGIRAVVKGPIRNMDELQAAAQKLLEGMHVRPVKANGA